MAKQRMGKTLVSVIVYTALLLVIAAVIGFVGVFTNWFTDDFKEFYISYDGLVLPKETTDLKISYKTENRFDVGYTFNFLNSDENKIKGYSISVIPNDKHDFDFIIDGNIYSFSAESGLTASFDIKQYDEYFTLAIPTERTMADILSVNYPEYEVETGDIQLYDTDYFIMLVYSYNEKSVCRISFRPYGEVISVELDKEGVII